MAVWHFRGRVTYVTGAVERRVIAARVYLGVCLTALATKLVGISGVCIAVSKPQTMQGIQHHEEKPAPRLAHEGYVLGQDGAEAGKSRF